MSPRFFSWKIDGDQIDACKVAELELEEELVNENEVFRTLDSTRSWHSVTSLADVGLSLSILDDIAQPDAQSAGGDSDCMFRTLDSLSHSDLGELVQMATPASVRSGSLRLDNTMAAGGTLAKAALPSPAKELPDFDRPEARVNGASESTVQPEVEAEPEALSRQPKRRPRQNKNRTSQYHWLEGLLGDICAMEARPQQTQSAMPLFVMAGACPNLVCGMQAACYFGSDDGSVDFWWLKPRKKDPQQLERETLTKHPKGSHKNGMGGTARAVHAPLAELFSGQGTRKGGFTFGIDAASGRAFIEEEASSARGEGRMLLYLVWQESWSSAVSRGHKFIAGKLCYQRSSGGSIGLYARQYRISDGEVAIAPLEEEVATILPSESLQEMCEMD